MRPRQSRHRRRRSARRILIRPDRLVSTANAAFIQLADHIYGVSAIHAAADVPDWDGSGFYYAGIGAVQTDDTGKPVSDSFQWIKPVGWTEFMADAGPLEYISYLQLYGCDGVEDGMDLSPLEKMDEHFRIVNEEYFTSFEPYDFLWNQKKEYGIAQSFFVYGQYVTTLE